MNCDCETLKRRCELKSAEIEKLETNLKFQVEENQRLQKYIDDYVESGGFEHCPFCGTSEMLCGHNGSGCDKEKGGDDV